MQTDINHIRASFPAININSNPPHQRFHQCEFMLQYRGDSTLISISQKELLFLVINDCGN